MFKMSNERWMRRRTGKSARQWKKLKKAERRGTTETRARSKRWERLAWEKRPAFTSLAVARAMGRRVRRLTPFFAIQAWEPGL